MKDMEFSVQDIKELMETLGRAKLSGLKIKHGDFSLEIEGAKTGQVISVPAAQPVQLDAASASAPKEYSGHVVTSPIVGTFYASPAPDKEPYVKTGSKVNKGDVLFIIESMKLMNEVTSEYSGTVTEIMAENAQGVEYGQPILCIV